MHGYSDPLRRSTLRDDRNLNNLLKAARSIEISSLQAVLIEASQKTETVCKVKFKPGKFKQNTRRAQNSFFFIIGVESWR